MTSAKLVAHQPIWESSRRPLHPKCVWIESLGATGATNSGHRHFIFDYNLTNSYRARSEVASLNESAHSCYHLEKAQSVDVMESKMTCLSIIGSGDKCKLNRAYSSLSDPPEMVNLFVTKGVHEPFELPDDAFVDALEFDAKESPVTPSMTRISNEIDSSKNLLADRVLQWLDLAGGRTYLSANRSQHTVKANASKRRSVTAKEPRKAFEHQDDTGLRTKVRHEPLRQLSMTFNEDAAKEPQTPNQTIVSINFGQLFPATYKCSRKFLALRRPKNGSGPLESLDLQKFSDLRRDPNSSPKRFSGGGGAGGGKGKPKRYEYFEDQYRSMIQRQILETSCNTQAAKRQLHIFMPNLPKKSLNISNTDKMMHLNSPKSGGDNDSCLSCRLKSTQF